jgi:hypothetical protein
MSETVAVYEAKLLDPKAETEYGHKAAMALVAIVKQAGLSRRFGGEKDHLFYEAWQALGKFYGYTIKTGWAEPVEFDGVKGFKARAEITDEVGLVIGGAEAYCMRDEPNWKNKPFFQLASMAQTRAGSKAMRNKLAFVVSLAGFEPTPAEEMDGVYEAKAPAPKEQPPKTPDVTPAKHDGLDQKQMQLKTKEMLLTMFGEEQAGLELEHLTSFKNKDGELVPGKMNVFELATKPNAKGETRTSITYVKVRELFKKFEEVPSADNPV